MSDDILDIPSSCLALANMAGDGAIEGWCVYADRPEQRATVELVLNGDVVRTMLATRMRADRNEHGVGDGYCGFWFSPIMDGLSAGRRVLEVRETRFGFVFGRFFVGRDDFSSARRLEAINERLARVDRKLPRQDSEPVFSEAIAELGPTLLHLAAQPKPKRRLGDPGVQAGLEKITEIPLTRLQWSFSPKYSFVLRAERDILGLAARIRGLDAALSGLRVEFILIDDGRFPLVALLPTRLKRLGLVRVEPSNVIGAEFNVAATAARGEFLIFARHSGRETDDLREALESARQGKVGLDSNVSDTLKPVTTHFAYHGLQCIVSRADFAALGGVDPSLRADELWANFIAKARALRLEIEGWEAFRPGPPAA